MKRKLLKAVAAVLAMLLSVSLCACSTKSSGGNSANGAASGQSTVDYEKCFYWDGDIVEYLSDKGSQQKKLVIPGHCKGFDCVLLSTKDPILEEVVFEGGYDIDIGTQFAYQTKLRSIKLPDELTVIPEGAFGGCTALEAIIIPANVTIVSSYAFEDGSIKSVTFQGTALTEIGKKAFYACPLGNIVFPDSVEAIGKSAFENCSNLTKLTLPKSLREIGDQAFMNAGLTDLYVPAEVELESIGFACFNNNENFVTVHVTEGSWMDLNFDKVFDNTFEKTYQ